MVNPLKLLLVCLLAALTVACATSPRTDADSKARQSQPQVRLNDFPTQDRVEYVFQCMRDHGGQNYDNLYHCVCMVDELAKQMTYKEYAEAQVFKNLRTMPGEQGGLFRDPPQSKILRDKLAQAEKQAEARCFVK